MRDKMEESIEINLGEMLKTLVSKVWLVILCALIVGGGALVYTSGFVTPLYQAKVSFYVNNNNVGQSLAGISSSDLDTSQKLVATYVNILKSNTVMDRVAEEAGLNVSAEKLRSMITAKAMGETELFEVYVTHPVPETAANIANIIADVAPKEIAEIVEGSSTKVIDRARVPAAPCSPSLAKNTVLGFVIGAVLAATVVILQMMLDVRIKTEEDLKRICDAPVLGVIPDFSTQVGEGYEYGSKTSQKQSSKAVKG